MSFTQVIQDQIDTLKEVMEANLSHTIQLTTGDWSGDGHSQTDITIIKSNLNEKELEAAYQAGVKVTGVDITEECTDYEDSQLSDSTLKRLVSLLPDGDLKEHLIEEEGLLWNSMFPEIYLFIAQQGNSNFRYKVIHLPTINIGGYGLFT